MYSVCELATKHLTVLARCGASPPAFYRFVGNTKLVVYLCWLLGHRHVKYITYTPRALSLALSLAV